MKHRLTAGLGVLLVLLVGCGVAGPSPWDSASDVSPTSAPTPATSGPCLALAEDRVRFTVEGAQRVVFATAERRRDTRVTLTGCVRTDGGFAEEWTARGFGGSGGFTDGPVTKVDSLETPTGSFTMTEAFGRSDPGTALDYHELVPQSRWGGRPGAYFNEYFEGPGAGPDENLWALMRSGLYEQAAVINVNRPPDATARPGQTYAIFLHAGMEESWGCISTDLETVTRVLQTVEPGDRMVMGVEEDVFAPAAG